jgi:spore germination protein
MIIHTVQPDESLQQIAEMYQISVNRLLRDNHLPPYYEINAGHSLIITTPSKAYQVQENDTLTVIADAHKVPLLQIIRNNPFLSERESLYVGDELAIQFKQDRKIKIIGYAFSHINLSLLKKSLPYLTYLSIINYSITPEGDMYDVHDSRIIELAKAYGVAPIMMISSLPVHGKGNPEINHAIFANPQTQKKLIDKILHTVVSKGFHGVNLGFQTFYDEDLPLYINFIANLTEQLNKLGHETFVTLIPSTYENSSEMPNNFAYLKVIGEVSNHVILLSYQWPGAFIPTVAKTTVDFLREKLEYIITQIPPEKIFIGLTIIAYDWELPYVDGKTHGSAMKNMDALNLANQIGAVITYDEATQTPYFYYNNSGVNHFVWFKDARSFQALINLVTEFNLNGLAIWNIMYFTPLTWQIINSHFEIETILGVTPQADVLFDPCC